MCLHVGHTRKCKHSSLALVTLVALSRAKTRTTALRSTSCGPGEILVPPGPFGLVDVCLEMVYAAMQRCDAPAQVGKYQLQHPPTPPPHSVDGAMLHLQAGERPGLQPNAPNAFSSPPERCRFKTQES